MAEEHFHSGLTASEIESRLQGAVVSNATQNLTDAQKSKARQNIGADGNTLINGLGVGSTSSVPADSDYFISQFIRGNEGQGGANSNKYYRRPLSALWAYVKGKISSVLGLSETGYTGNAATATSAGTLTSTLPVTLGGTGATTAEDARTSIGALSASDIEAKVIPQSSDLNEYLAPGMYYYPTDSTANSVLNYPGGKSAFGLEVKRVGQAAYYQSIVTNRNKHYERVYRQSTWADWTEVR